MKKWLQYLGLLVVVFSFLPMVAIAVEKPIVNTLSLGNTLYVGGSGPGNYTSIQDAINNASDGDTVFVYNGTYMENIVVYKSINLIGENKNITIIDGNSVDNVVHIIVDSVTVKEFTIRNNGEFPKSCVYIGPNYNPAHTSNHNTISDNIINTNRNFFKVGDGIRLVGSNYNIITNNLITSNIDTSFLTGNGISLTYLVENGIRSNSNNIFCNVITQQRDGIWAIETNENNFSHNIIYNNKGNGIMLIMCNHSIVSHNDIFNNLFHGVSIFSQVIPLDCSSSFIFIERNNISKNHLCGIVVEGLAHDISIHKNQIVSNEETGVALLYTLKSDIKYNNFINNGLHALFRTSFTNRWNGNYWDDWVTPIPKPIIGSIGLTPSPLIGIKIPWINYDLNPAQDPYTY